MAMIAALLVPANGLAAQEATPGERVDEGYEPLSDSDVKELIASSTAYWRSFRDRYGFDTSDKAMASIAMDPRNRASLEEVGVPFTADELVEVRARAELGFESTAVADELLRTRSDYAGMLVDNEAGGVLRIFFTKSPTSQEVKDIRSSFSSPKRVEFQETKHSLVDLLKALDTVAANTSSSSLIHSGGIDLANNALYVAVDDRGDASLRPALRSEALKETRALSGEIEVLVKYESPPQDDGCNSRTNCGSGSTDLRGGLQGDDASATDGCSTGFVFVDTSNGDDFVSTAGHCDNTANTDVTISTHVSTQYDTSTNAMQSNTGGWITSASTTNAAGVTINGDTEADAIMIDIPNNKKSNDVFKWASYKAWFINKQITSFQGPTVGTEICSAGYVILFRCGEVKSQWAFHTSSSTGASVVSQIRWEYVEDGILTSLGGASGAPLIGDQGSNLTKRQAVGTHASSSFSCDEYNPSPPHNCIATLVSARGSKIAYVQSLTGMTILQSDPG